MKRTRPAWLRSLISGVGSASFGFTGEGKGVQEKVEGRNAAAVSSWHFLSLQKVLMFRFPVTKTTFSQI